MRATILIFALLVSGVSVSVNNMIARSVVTTDRSAGGRSEPKPEPTTLCAKDERVIFSCPVKKPAKIVSVCASKELTSDRGYLHYRFGLPGKIELEFPKDRKGTQENFQYIHYFRAQFDMTAINFTIDGYEYSVFDDYNGEEKPAVSSQGVSVTAPGKPKEVSFVCRSKPKADYTDLQAVLPGEQE